VTLEYKCVRVVIGSYACTVIVVYRPGSESVQALFFDELAELLDWVATMAEPLFVVGDLNVRLDRADDVHAARLVDLLAGYGFENRVSAPTHRRGVMFDVVATHCDLLVPIVKVVDVGLSDHEAWWPHRLSVGLVIKGS